MHAGDCNGVAYCVLFNKIIAGHSLPKYLSYDNDPLFLFHRWKANLRVMGIVEIKTIPGNPTSHPFVERVIGTIRREYLDHTLFFNARDLHQKLSRFQTYYNENRVHSTLGMKTPKEMAADVKPKMALSSVSDYRWQSHCNGLYTLPIAA